MLGYYIRPCHVIMCNMQKVGPNVFVCNENIAYVMPHGTEHAVMPCVHHAVCACRQASHPMHMWHARNYLWMQH